MICFFALVYAASESITTHITNINNAFAETKKDEKTQSNNETKDDIACLDADYHKSYADDKACLDANYHKLYADDKDVIVLIKSCNLVLKRKKTTDKYANYDGIRISRNINYKNIETTYLTFGQKHDDETYEWSVTERPYASLSITKHDMTIDEKMRLCHDICIAALYLQENGVLHKINCYNVSRYSVEKISEENKKMIHAWCSELYAKDCRLNCYNTYKNDIALALSKTANYKAHRQATEQYIYKLHNLDTADYVFRSDLYYPNILVFFIQDMLLDDCVDIVYNRYYSSVQKCYDLDKDQIIEILFECYSNMFFSCLACDVNREPTISDVKIFLYNLHAYLIQCASETSYD